MRTGADSERMRHPWWSVTRGASAAGRWCARGVPAGRMAPSGALRLASSTSRPRRQRLVGRQPVHRCPRASTSVGPDVVLFVNGLPLAVIELKNPADENATVWSAYSSSRPTRPRSESVCHNAALVASDGVQGRIGTLGGKEWFSPGARSRAGRRPCSDAGVAVRTRRDLREAAVLGSGPLLHRVRDPGAASSQEDGGYHQFMP